MTATQVFLLFLKKNCILEEYLFFRNTIMNNNGNRYFRKRRLYRMYVRYYTRLWNKFLRECIDDSEKKINSPFKKGETYNFRLNTKVNDTRL